MRPILPRLLGGACAAAMLALVAGCGTPPAQRPTPQRPAALKTPPLPPPPKAGPEMFNAAAVDDLEDEEAVHFFARRADGALLVHVKGGRFLARAAALDGTPKADKPVDIGAAPSGTAELVIGSLRPAGDGYVLAWAERQDGRTRIATLALEASGAARGARANLTEIGDEVSWVDILPRDGGSLLLWETSQGHRYDVTGIALDAKGAAASPAAPLLTGVLGWHAAPGGGALAAVLPASAKPTADDDTGLVQTGKVALITLEASGKPRAPVEISASTTAEPDVVILEVAGKWVLAWTDVREVDAAVWTAALDKTGAITAPPKRATPPTGEQALVAAVGAEPFGPSVPRGLLAWEDVLNAPPESRQIHLATLGPDGTIGKERATMAFHAAGTPPDLSADATGFGAVTLAPAWQGGPPPEEAPVWPTFVRFGPDLSVLSAEPVRTQVLGSDGVPYLVHGLACRDTGCTTLASGGQAPPKVAVVSLASRKTEWYPPARRDPDDAPPRAASLAALYNGEQIARVAVTPLSAGGHLAAWVSYYPEGPAAQRAKQNGSAEVALVVAPPGQVGAPTPVQLSKKAVSVGGVAVAAAPGEKKEIAIAWVAREKGESQVYVTKVDETGKKLAQKKLTVIGRMKKGGTSSEASDVAIAWSSAEGAEGWIVSWVDTRDGNAEVYAARIDRSLNKVGPDHRITDAPGDAAEVQLLPRSGHVLVAWSDARAEPEEGRGDIYVARIEPKGLTKLAPEVRLAATPTHSRSPQLALAPGGAVWASWVEDASDTDAGGAVRIAVLDEKGAATTTTSLAGSAGKAIVSAAIACTEKACRGVVARSASDALLLDAFPLSPAAQPLPSKTLLTLPGAGSADISPMFADRAATSLFFAADAAAGTGRVRHMKIDW